MGYIDKTLGFLFGLLRIYILASIIFGVFIQKIEQEKRPLYIQSSNLTKVIESSNNFLFSNFPGLESFNYQSYDNQNIISEEERDMDIE